MCKMYPPKCVMGQTYSAVMKSIITRCNNNIKVDNKMHVSITEECTDIRDNKYDEL